MHHASLRSSAVAALLDLVDLVNDAVDGAGPRPAFTAATGDGARAARPPRSRAGYSRPEVNWSVETPPVRPTVSRSESARSTDDSASPEDPDVDQEIDEEHVEIWTIVARAQSGDGEAFGLLYDRYVDLVFRFIYYRVNDRALAEDFTSETFLRALRRIGSISYQGRDIGAWFVTIARNIVLDHHKSARNRLETTTGETIESRDHERSTEAAVLELLQSERLMAAVRQLGAEQRECIMLRFLQGLSVSETAAAMGKNDGAIKALQHRAVRKLADLVGGELR